MRLILALRHSRTQSTLSCSGSDRGVDVEGLLLTGSRGIANCTNCTLHFVGVLGLFLR